MVMYIEARDCERIAAFANTAVKIAFAVLETFLHTLSGTGSFLINLPPINIIMLHMNLIRGAPA